MKQAISTSWHQYGKLHPVGHKIVQDIFQGPVIIEEKIDGSQFSFGIFDGELRCRSKGVELHVMAPDKMFQAAVEVVQQVGSLLRPGWTYRGEYLQRAKHNALAYDRIPSRHIIGFDINTAQEVYLDPVVKAEEFRRLGMETVPLLHHGVLEDVTQLREYLERTSILGSQKIEGVVVKNYAMFGPDGTVLRAKFVSEAFKEVHANSWREENPNRGDLNDRLIAAYRTPARWQKAVMRARELGTLSDSPQDIGFLMRDVMNDIEIEAGDEIKAVLFNEAWKRISRGVVAGLAEWYKEQLLNESLTRTEEYNSARTEASRLVALEPEPATTSAEGIRLGSLTHMVAEYEREHYARDFDLPLKVKGGTD